MAIPVRDRPLGGEPARLRARRAEAAARLHGFAERLTWRPGSELFALERQRSLIFGAREALPHDEWEMLVTEGGTLDAAEAIAVAIDDVSALASATPV